MFSFFEKLVFKICYTALILNPVMSILLVRGGIKITTGTNGGEARKKFDSPSTSQI
jgi:hypothetical protein